MKWKFGKSWFLLFVCFLLVLSVISSTKNIVKADDFYPNDSLVTFGLYSFDEDKIIESQPDYYFDHIKYGMAHGIYNFLKKYNSNNANFPNEVSVIYQNLVDLFGSDFFAALSDYRWLVNVYAYNQGETFYLFFQRADGYSVAPMVERTFNMNDTITVELLPEGARSSYYVLDDDKIWCYSPYFINSGLPVGTSSSYIMGSAFSSFETINDLKGALSNLNTRAFKVTIHTTSTFTFTIEDQKPYCVYYDEFTLKGFRAYSLSMLLLHPVMIDFPVYNTGAESGYPVFSYKGYESYITLYYNRLSNSFSRNYNLSPIILSSYGEINPPTPTPTFTPTPLPTFTPYPTATPFPPVNEIEGIGQMMTLFTRKYEININGNVFGIRPLYLFVFCVLVGTIFSAVQGGDRS